MRNGAIAGILIAVLAVGLVVMSRSAADVRDNDRVPAAKVVPTVVKKAAAPKPEASATDWKCHYLYVREFKQTGEAVNKMVDRIKDACEALPKEDFGELYADLGVNIAKIGMRRLRWNPGQGIRDPKWYSHYSHVVCRHGKEDGRDKLISWFQKMRWELPPKDFAVLYADVMTRIASYEVVNGKFPRVPDPDHGPDFGPDDGKEVQIF